MSRLTPLPRAALTPAQQEQYDRLARNRTLGADEQLGGPFDPWVRSPELAARAPGFGNFLWNRTSLGRRIVELAILVTGRHWRSNVEWVAHEAMARQAGVSDAVIQSVFDVADAPTDAPADEQLTMEFCRTLHSTREVPLELYKRAVDQFGEQGVMELVAAVGFYTMVSMTLNTFNIPTADGEPTPFPRPE